jgi:hypothetical protein
MLWFLRKVSGTVALAWLALWGLFLISAPLDPKAAASAFLLGALTSVVGAPAAIIWAALKVIDVLGARRAPEVATPLPSFSAGQVPRGAVIAAGTRAPAPLAEPAGPVTPGVPGAMTAAPTSQVSAARPDDSDVPGASPPTGAIAPSPPKQDSVSRPIGPEVYTYSAPGQPLCPECGRNPTIFHCTTHGRGVCLQCVARHDDPKQCVYVPAFRAAKPSAGPGPASGPEKPPSKRKPGDLFGIS